MATISKDTTTAKASTAKKADTPSYGEQAAALAADTRALVDSIREDLGKLTDNVAKLNDTEPGAEDGPAADGVRRIPMALDEVTRALSALDHTAADLARTAATG